MSRRGLLDRHVALPGDHGSWVFLLGPLLIGLFAAGRWRTASLYLVVAALAAFLLRQPLTLVVKVLSGRRSPEVLPVAAFWIAVYGALGLVHLVGLVSRGHVHVLYLALPGVPVFAWYLWLVSRRAERRQRLMEILAAGSLGLVAPAALWVGRGEPDPRGWLLWALVWAQSTASILHAYLRLEQRRHSRVSGLPGRLRLGAPALAVTSLNTIASLAMGLAAVIPFWLFLPYALQALETVRAALRPSPGLRPAAIGLRQLAVSTLFTALFIVLWR